jgi:hypothetical protein
MNLQPIALLSALAICAAAMPLAPTDVKAGQYKTLSTELLEAGSFVPATSSPKNSGSAMELEVYEFKTAAGASYRCEILTNVTGVSLNIRLIHVTGVEVASCIAPAAGACNTAYVAFGPHLKPLCLVATAPNSAVVGANPIYTMAVKRM